jgi:hypothetical protein
MLVSFKKITGSKLKILFLKGFCYAFAVLPFAVLMFSYTGFASSFDSVRIGKTTIILLEKYETGGESMESVCRLHVLDRKTGEKIYRKHLGNAAYFREERGDTLLMEINRASKLFYAPDFTTIKDITKESLAKEFPDLSEGVEKIDDSGNDKPFCIVVSGLNGKQYSYFPFTNKLVAGRIENSKTVHTSFTTDKEIIRAYTEGNHSTDLLQLKSNSDSKINSLFYKDTLVKGKEFLLGEFVDFDTIKYEAAIKYFTNTKEENFILSHLDKNLNETWKFEQAKENLTDYFSSKEKLDVFIADKNFFYFNCGGFFLCLDKYTGKTVWRTRL